MGSIGTRRGPGGRLGAVLSSAALLITAAGAISGCGDDNSSSNSSASAQGSPTPQPGAGGSEREQVAATANAYLSALNDADGDKACAQLTEAAKAEFILKANEAASESKSCEEVVRRYSELYLSGELNNARVTEVRVNGTLAEAQGPADIPLIPEVLRLTKEGDRWLISDGVRTLRQSQSR